MSTWTINGRTTPELRVGRLRIDLVSQGADVVTFLAPGAAYDGGALFAYREPVLIAKDGAPWFSGLMTSVPRSGGAPAESISYQVSGPWWYLEKRQYEQSWMQFDRATQTVKAVSKSRVVLCQGAGNAHLTNGEQIRLAVQYAIDQGAPIKLGTIDPDIPMPFDEQVDVTCSQVIERMLRVSPDCIVEFDYSTVPPTFHCRRRASLPAVTVTVPGPTAVAIVRRDDLVVRGFLLRYEQVHTVSTDAGDSAYRSFEIDQAGDVTDIAAIKSTIELAGSRKTQTMLSQTIVTERLPTNLNDLAWWQKHVPALAAKDGTTVTIENARRSGLTGERGQAEFDRLLIEGTVHAWMPVEAREEEFSAEVTVHARAASPDVSEQVTTRTYTFRATTTNARTGTDNKHTYKRTGSSSYDPGETVPAGVAARLFAAWSQVQYQGSITLKSAEVPGVRARALNIAGGRDDWREMRALVQSISEDVDLGETTLTFGPANHLTVSDLISLLSSFRRRGYSYHYSERETGEVGGGAGADGVDLGGTTAKGDASAAGDIIRKLVLSDNGKTLRFDPALIQRAGATLQPREIQVCVDGMAKTICFLCSEPY